MLRYFTLLLGFLVPLLLQGQNTTKNGLSVKIQSDANRPVNYYVQDLAKIKNAAHKDSTLRVIVKFKSDPKAKSKSRSAVSAVEQDHANFLTDLQKIESTHRQRTTFIQSRIHHHFKNAFNGKSITASNLVIDQLKKLPYVQYIVEDKLIKVSDTQSNTIIEADKVWSQFNSTGKGIVIGIIDTGIDYNHPDISDGFGVGHKVIGGYDFVNDDSDPMDDHGHGTHVAGIAAANGATLKGVAPDASLMAFKVLTKDGWGYDSWILSGIERSMDPDQNPNTDDHVDVVNMSLGRLANGFDPLSEAVDNAVNAGIVFAVAAGNDGGGGYQTIGSPGIAPNAITVGATDSSDALAYFSSKGPAAGNFAMKPDLTAPGVNIFSSLPGGNYASWSGTSMATPHVAGAAALLLQLHPTWTPVQVKAVLMQGATPISLGRYEAGSGRLDVFNAAKYTFGVSPGSIDINLVSSPGSVVSTVFQLTVFNYSGSAKTYSLTSDGDIASSAIQTTIDKSSFTLSSGATQVVNVTVQINKANLSPRSLPGLYLGNVIVADNTTQVKVPVGIAYPETVHVHFDSPLPDFAAVYGMDNYFFKFVVPTSNDVDLIIDPGQYGLTSLYGVHFVAKENISIPQTKSITISKSEASNMMVFQPSDEKGNKIAARDNMLGQALITTLPPHGAGYMTLFMGPVDTLYFSNLSSDWLWQFRILDFDKSGSNKLFSIGYSDKGASQSKVITNSPGDFVSVKFDYPHEPNSTVGLRSFITTKFSGITYTMYNGNSIETSSEFIEYYQKQSKDQLINQTNHIIETNSGYNFETSGLTIFKNDSIAYTKGIIPSLTESSILATPSALNVKLGETMIHWSSAMSNDLTTILVNPFYLSGHFRNNQGDKILGKVNYTLSNSSGVIKNGYSANPSNFHLLPGENDALLFSGIVPGPYSMKIDFTDYQVQGKFGKASVKLDFNTQSDDKNPPYLFNFDLKVNGHLSNKIAPGDEAHIYLNVVDDCYAFNYACFGTNSGVATFSLSYRKLDDTDWIQLSKDTYTTSIPANLTEGYYSLQVMATDISGNSLVYNLEPAFLVGTNPNPVPFRKVQLTYPADQSQQIAQNTTFQWIGVAGDSEYHFQLSTDNTFTTLAQDLTFNTNSVKLATPLNAQTKYFWRVNAKNAGQVSPWSDPFSFTTSSGVTNAIKLISPENGASNLGGPLKLVWSSVPNVNSYTLYVEGTYPNGSKYYFNNQINDTTYYLSVFPSMSWTWKVMPVYQNINGEWSETRSFYTRYPIITLSPANNTVINSLSPLLSWNDNFGNGSYSIQVSASSDFATLLVNQSYLSTESFQLSNLQYGNVYYWKIRGDYPSTSVWSDVGTFSTDGVMLINPPDQSTNQDLSILFKWEPVPSATQYEVRVATSSNFAESTIKSFSTTEGMVTNLLPSTQYFWKVGVISGVNEYWSAPFSFHTAAILEVDPTKTSQVYPNPASTYVNFKFESPSHSVSVVNYLGQSVWNQQGNESAIVWNIAGIENGIYIAQIQDGEKTINQKIAICR